MLKGLGDLGNIMKMQREFKAIQKRLKSMESEGESPGGDVRVVMNGEYKCLSISINDDFIKNHESKKIEKMVVSAVNQAVEKVKERSASEMSQLAGGMDLGGLLNFNR